MQWTNDKPKTPGVYWYRSSATMPQLVDVYDGTHCRWLQGRGETDKYRLRGEWSDTPIPQPANASREA